MVWLMVGLPAACLVAIAVTLRTALAPDATSVSPDAVARTAQVQTTDLSADQQASSLGLQASLSIDDRRVRLRMQLSDPQPERLRLLASHPTHESEDRVIWLQRGSDGDWQAQLADPEHADAWPGDAVAWSLSLSPEDARWRIDGLLPAGSTKARLAPRFAASANGHE